MAISVRDFTILYKTSVFCTSPPLYPQARRQRHQNLRASVPCTTGFKPARPRGDDAQEDIRRAPLITGKLRLGIVGSNLRHFGFVTSGFRGETVSEAAPPSPCASLQPLCIQRDGSYVVQPRRDLVLHGLAGDASRGITGNNQKREFSQKFVGLIVNHKAAINLRVGTQVRGDGLKLFSRPDDIDFKGTQPAQKFPNLFMWVREAPAGVNHDANWEMRAEKGLQIREPFKGKTGANRPTCRVQYAIKVDEDSPHCFLPVWVRLAGVHASETFIALTVRDASRLMRRRTRPFGMYVLISTQT